MPLCGESKRQKWRVDRCRKVVQYRRTLSLQGVATHPVDANLREPRCVSHTRYPVPKMDFSKRRDSSAVEMKGSFEIFHSRTEIFRREKRIFPRAFVEDSLKGFLVISKISEIDYTRKVFEC